MNSVEFENIFEQQVEACRRTLIRKAAEYTGDEDRLSNFRIAAALQTTNPFDALGGMLAKHVVSIFDLVRKEDPTTVPLEVWDEKIGDALNYLILLKAMVVESKVTQLIELQYEDNNVQA